MGFYTHRVGAYNAYILLSVIQLPRSFEGFTSSPVATLIAVGLSVGVLAFVWYVRSKLFPDFAFITPKKIRGRMHSRVSLARCRDCRIRVSRRSGKGARGRSFT